MNFSQEYSLPRTKNPFEKACYQGQLDIVKGEIEKGTVDWNEGVLWACAGGQLAVAKLLIQEGYEFLCAHGDWNMGLRNACYIKNFSNYTGHIMLAKLMIRMGANDWNMGLRNACYTGHIMLTKLMIRMGANDFDSAKKSADNGGYPKLAKLMELEADRWKEDHVSQEKLMELKADRWKEDHVSQEKLRELSDKVKDASTAGIDVSVVETLYNIYTGGPQKSYLSDSERNRMYACKSCCAWVPRGTECTTREGELHE